MTVNSGGEKIFVEEVERAIAGHPAVADVVVTGRPGERWGSEVVAVVQLAEGARRRPTRRPSSTHASGFIARYKLPKEVVFVERIQRSPSGKADYRWAAETAVKAAQGASAAGDGSVSVPGPIVATRAARPPTVHRRGPGALRRAQRPPARGRVAGLVAHPGRERRPGRRYRRGDGARGLGAVGGRGARRARPSSAWSACTGCNAASRSPRRWRWAGGSIPTTGATATPPRRPPASLAPRLRRGGLDEIVAFTARGNIRSQAVMDRIGMVRDPTADFDHPRCPRAARCGATCSTGSTASQRAALRWRRDRATRVTALRLGRTDPEMIAYHDTEWGVPVHDDPTHFEFLVLEGAQAGLSWVDHPQAPRRLPPAFADFDAAKVARFTPTRVEKLLLDPGIIRNRAKVEATVRNARAFLAVQEEFGSFDTYIWGFVGGRPKVNRWRRTGQLPASTPISEALSADLRRRGFGFVGPDRLLRPPPGGRTGQRPPGELLPLRRAHRGRRIRTRTPKRAMTGSSGGQPVRHQPVVDGTRPRRSPRTRRRARSRARRGRWPA